MSADVIGNLVRGMGAGEAAGWMNADFRIFSLPAKRVNRLRILSKLGDDDRTTIVPRPFAHATPPAALHPGAGDNLEWFAFTLAGHRATAGTGSRDLLHAAWIDLAERPEPVRSRIGTRLALTNLRNGLRPPQSGHDNAHYFDDIAMSRALAAVVEYAGNEEEILAAAVADAEVTHSLDGVWCARGTALLFSRLLAGDAPAEAAAVAAASLPPETWSARMAAGALEIAAGSAGPLDLARRLSTELGDWVYSYPVTAPETFGFLLAHVSRAQNAESLLLGALAQGRNAASLPALVGAAAGVLYGSEWTARDLGVEELRLTGLCVPEYAGRAIAEFLPAA